jgi:hypothetical protein
MLPKDYRFLAVENDTQCHAQRKKELQRAEARSHAAKIAHRRKSFKGRPEMKSLACDVAPTAWAMDTGLLDPFVVLSMELNIEDRDLLHGCKLLT